MTILKKSRIFLVQPGLGKTHLAETRPEFLDFDTGSIRKKLIGYDKSGEKAWREFRAFYPAMTEAFSISRKLKDYILMNEPGLVQHIMTKLKNVEVTVVLAQDPQEWYERIKLRDGEDSEFAKSLKKNNEIWYKGWENTPDATSFIKIPSGKYLSDIIDDVIK